MVKTPMTTDNEACRAVFERVIEDAGSYDFTRDADGDYVKPDTWEAFQGFKAAWSARPTQPLAGLVEKMEMEAFNPTGDDRMGKFIPLAKAIDLIRTHQPVISEERLEELTEAVEVAIAEELHLIPNKTAWEEKARRLGKAALSVVLKELGGEG